MENSAGCDLNKLYGNAAHHTDDYMLIWENI